MDAMLYHIQSRSRNVDIEAARLDHFLLGTGETTSAQRVIDELSWSPYLIDMEKRQAVFVDIPPEIDLSQAVFAHLEQYHHARRLLVMPVDSLLALSPQVSHPSKVIFFFNIARCGTTLVNKVINQVDGVWSLSEPDVYLPYYTVNPDGHDEEELVELVRVCTGLLFRPPSGVQADTLGIKFRSQGLFSADLFYRAFPEARFVFIYRDALSWANSFYRMTARMPRPDGMDDEGFTRFMWWILSAETDISYTEPFFDLASAIIYPELVYAPVWIIHLEHYIRHLEAGLPFFALRYNELNNQPESVTAQLLEHCGLPTESLPQALKAFEGDAQEGTDIARSIKVAGFNDEQYARLRMTLAKHPRFGNPDLLLPDIYDPISQNR